MAVYFVVLQRKRKQTPTFPTDSALTLHCLRKSLFLWNGIPKKWWKRCFVTITEASSSVNKASFTWSVTKISSLLGELCTLFSFEATPEKPKYCVKLSNLKEYINSFSCAFFEMYEYLPFLVHCARDHIWVKLYVQIASVFLHVSISIYQLS